MNATHTCTQCHSSMPERVPFCPRCGSRTDAAAPTAAPDSPASTRTRGRVLRDTVAGDGLLVALGRQYAFSLETHWKSDVAPTVNMAVDVDFDGSGAVTAVRAVSGATVGQERMRDAVDGVREVSGRALGEAAAIGLPLAARVVSAVGYANLGAIALLLIGWFSLNAIAIQVTASTASGLSFYDLLRALHSMNNFYALEGVSQMSAGWYGFACYLTLALCIAPFLFRRKSLWLGLAAPLAWMVAVYAGIYWKISSAVSEIGGAAGMTGLSADFAREMAAEVSKAISFGAGFYVAGAAALYLAFKGVKQYLSA
ncbi:hypothetical protein [Burkholderia aenigmatica]|uniref:hypothetical protein n=1 Tax=Burkholderia aenigmatica TaxID=2015348 RepID=UPI0011782BE2|nr:hypothetical protein [Burkholderia aenigmatica]